MKTIQITCLANSDDAKLFTSIVNQGIDAHLEAFTKSKFDHKPVNGLTRLVLDFEVSELPLLCRRLDEIGSDEAEAWASDIRELPEYPKATRDLNVIAREIKKDWHKVYFGAVPYLDAMMHLDSIDGDYGCDSAKSIVLYFLSNAKTWRGEVAKRIKAELKGML
jgi:hypothetical protein